MTINTEGGLRPSRIEYVPETEQGVTPSDPDWQLPSDRVTSFETDGFGPEPVEKAALGDTVHELEAGLEEASLTIGYDMQRWFKDTNGNPNSLEAYGMSRNSAGLMPASVTILERMRSGDQAEGPMVAETSTVEYQYNGSGSTDLTRRETHIYTVAKGCDVNEPTITGDPTEVDWAVEASLAAEHARSYQIDQPQSGGRYLHVQSTDSADTGLHVVIENSDASTTETVQLDTSDATTAVATASTFSEIDAVEVHENDGGSPGAVADDHAGDILVLEDDGSGTDAPGLPAATLAVLYGSNYYGNTYGDPGIPTLGAGSRGAALNSGFYKVGNMAVERPPGEQFEATGAVQSVELSLANNVERTAQESSREQRLHHGMLVPEATITYDSETGSHANLVERMAMTDEDMVFAFNRDNTETLTYLNSTPTESGRSRSATENNTEQEVTVRAQNPGLDISNASP